MAFSWSSKLGVVALAPWVALIGFDLGIVGGLAAAVISVGLWIIANHVSNVSVDGAQIAVRVGSMVILGVGSALAGRRLRTSEEAQRTVVSLQSALIDATLDGICLTDEDGAVLISNRPLRRLSLELGLPQVGTVPERLLAVADKVVEPDRYRQRMLELAHAPGRVDDRRVRGRSDRAGVPRVHGAGLQSRRQLRGSHLDAARGHRRPRARPDARRVRRDRVARAANAADVDLGLSRDDAGGRAGSRRERQALPRRDPAEYEPAARARRGPAPDRTDRSKACRTAARASRRRGAHIAGGRGRFGRLPTTRV